MIPHDTYGYAVNEQTGEIHRRYADHAKGLRRTTNAGIYAVLGDKDPAICETCWPPEKKPRTKKAGRSWVEHHGDDEPIGKVGEEGWDDPLVTSTAIDLRDAHGGS